MRLRLSWGVVEVSDMEPKEIDRMLELLRESLSDLEFVRERLAVLPVQPRNGHSGRAPRTTRRELVERIAGAESALRQALSLLDVELD